MRMTCTKGMKMTAVDGFMFAVVEFLLSIPVMQVWDNFLPCCRIMECDILLYNFNRIGTKAF